MTRRTECVVLDLDNTLWDWVDIWYHSFSAMLEEIASISSLASDALLPHIQEIYRRHGTSEYSFVIEELDILRELHGPGADIRRIYDPAVEAFREARASSLRLYPGVLDTLVELRSKGVRLVAYTESLMFYSVYRVSHLGLDGMLDYLYAPEGHAVPKELNTSKLKYFDLELKNTQIRYTPTGQLKPAPQILTGILNKQGFSPSRSVYVGDSLMKDVAMAEQAGVYSAHASYGSARAYQYELLKRVSYWTDEDMAREAAISASPVHSPRLVLKESLQEILDIGDFGAAG